MRALLVPAALLLLLATALPVEATHRAPDGYTASIAPRGGVAGIVWVQDTTGHYTADITLYQKVDGAWERVAMQATLRACYFRVFSQQDVCQVSVPFASSASGSVAVRFPSSQVSAPGPFDLFVSFTQVSTLEYTPTSHYSPVKETALGLGLFDLVDELDLDYHGVIRPVGI